MLKNLQFSSLFLYFVAAVSSLSSAGATMTLLALSTSFFREYPEGFASSGIQLIYYLGIGSIGILGGGILQKWSTVAVGIFGPLISALIVFFLAMFETIPLIIGFPAIFLIFLLNGLDHPNNLRFFNESLSSSQKISFFSFTESLTAVFQIVSPLVAGAIIVFYGVRICFVIDGCTYLISALPWLIIKRRMSSMNLGDQERKVNLFLGFRVLYENLEVRSLTISRLLNNLAYVTCTSAIPLVIAGLANKDQSVFAYQLAVTNAIVSAGFIIAGLIGAKISQNSKNVVGMVYLASALGLISCVLLTSSWILPPLLYLSACLLGIGTYCFRISGMTLGQAFTPAPVLGPVIIAGDTVVRSWSLFVSASTLLVFEMHAGWGISFGVFFLLVNLLPCGSILAPKWALQLARKHEKETQSI